MKELLNTIRQCKICEEFLPLGAKPILSASINSKILLISQAPGRIAHEKNTAWKDPGGVQLRKWLGVSDDQFFDSNNFAILPMGFCYPGKGKTGDLPPRPECMPQWHSTVLQKLNSVKLTILIGNYSQRAYLKNTFKRNLTETVKNYTDYLPQFLPLPHPSPVNRFWLAKNPWFPEKVVPEIQAIVKTVLTT